MQKEIHLGNSCIDYVLFLPENLSAAKVVVVHMVDSLDKHTAGTTSRIINGLTGLRVKDTNKKLNHRTRSIKFSCLCF